MKKFVCSVCGYVHEGEAAPANCPVCKVPADKFKEMVEGAALAAEHEYGVYFWRNYGFNFYWTRL